MRKDLVIGIDTSNYKTSVAVTDGGWNVLYERSEFLEVEQGERGLRQSVAFFRHSDVLPLFIEEAFETVRPSDIAAVSVSDKPRNVEGSYMPVFLAGLHAGRILSASLGVPLKRFSHQEGHIEAILSGMTEVPDTFLLFHLSGGTTEALSCRRSGEHIEAEIIGGTKDISVGQLLDRVGVRLGYPFPAGGSLDRIAAREPVTRKPKKIRCTDGWFNLSGTESEMMREIEKTGEEMIPGLFERLSELLYTAATQCSEKTGIPHVMMAGGVSMSETVRERLLRWSGEKKGPIIRFGPKERSGDNAVGIALLGGRTIHETRNGIED